MLALTTAAGNLRRHCRKATLAFGEELVATFVDRLDGVSARNRSLLCVGLDPDPALMPIEDVTAFNREIVDATHDLVCAYKPNLAFYEALGIPGLEALERTVEHIRSVAPDVIVLGDAKRGDVGHVASAYAKALFQVWGFDAATVNPYLGKDSVEPFLEYQGRGVFLLCRTSNPGAGDLQDRLVASRDGGAQYPLYRMVALLAGEWDQYGNVGLVLGATYPRELAEVRALCPQMPFLVPGIGVQEGSLEEAVRGATDAEGRRAIISASRSIIYASRDSRFGEAARRSAEKLRDAINRILVGEGQGW